jgi:hypothetical protein
LEILKELFEDAVNNNHVTWQRHAFQRMLERNISRSEVKRVLLDGEIIQEYPNDHPFPSYLILGYIDKIKPLHVVAALDKKTGWCYIITAYRPDLSHFKDDYKTRKK